MPDRDVSNARGVLICANPFSGSGPNRRHVDGLVAALQARGFQPRLVWDVQQRQSTLSDPGLGQWCRCVVVAGGDGSIGAVVNELCRDDGRGAGQSVALATLPMGNENLFAQYFGFTQDVEQLAQAIEAGKTHRIDLGKVSSGASDAGGWLFTLMAGVGFDADVVHRMHRWRSTHRGLRRVRRISYLPRILSSLWHYKHPKLRVRADDEELTGVHLFVFNLPKYGGGLSLAPCDCAVDDGRLDWVLFQRPGVLAMLGYAWSVFRGRHLARHDVKHGKSASLTISAPAGAAVQVDGDPSGVVPVVLSVAKQVKLELLKIEAADKNTAT